MLYYDLGERSPLQLQEGDLTPKGVITKARKSTSKDEIAWKKKYAGTLLADNPPRFYFVVNGRELNNFDFGSSVHISRPRAGTETTILKTAKPLT